MQLFKQIFNTNLNYSCLRLQGPCTQQRNLSGPALPRVLPASRRLQGLLRQLPSTLRAAIVRQDVGSEVLETRATISPEVQDLVGRRFELGVSDEDDSSGKELRRTN